MDKNGYAADSKLASLVSFLSKGSPYPVGNLTQITSVDQRGYSIWGGPWTEIKTPFTIISHQSCIHLLDGHDWHAMQTTQTAIFPNRWHKTFLSDLGSIQGYTLMYVDLGFSKDHPRSSESLIPQATNVWAVLLTE